MPVTDQHLEYAAALPVWLRHCDVLRDEDAVKARGQAFLRELRRIQKLGFNYYAPRLPETPHSSIAD